MKIIFMGTPEIAAQCLQMILSDTHHEVCAVYTRPDKPVGRKQILTPPPVKVVAQEHGISVFQPKNLREVQTVEQIKSFQADCIVVVAYGCILPKDVLNVAVFGAINLHVSLLPKYRGAAPVQWSIINGETKTGVTIMQLDEGLDTGDILHVVETPIGENETSEALFLRVTELGKQALCDTMMQIEQKTVNRIPQNHDEATLAPMLTKEMAQFTFAQKAKELHHLICGMNPWPIAFFVHEEKKIKVKSSRFVQQCGRIGEILSVKPLVIACQTDALELDEVVPQGSKPMSGSAWAVGKRLQKGDFLGAI